MEKAVVSSGCGSGSVGPLAVPRRGDHSKTGNFRRERKQQRQHSGQQADWGRQASRQQSGWAEPGPEWAGRSGGNVMGWLTEFVSPLSGVVWPFNKTMETKNLKS